MKYFLVGIKGTGMSALAQILDGLGYEVEGSDKPDHFFTEQALIDKGIKIYEFNKDNIKEDMIIIQGNAFKDNHEEIVRAKELNLKIYSYQDMVGKLTKMFQTITIAGCHGKTTTTSMLSHVLKNITGCNYLIGDGTGYANKENKYFALEACEYKRHFLNYTPYYAIITNIELDHIDYYKDIQDVIDAFSEFANKALKMVIACGDDNYTRYIETNKPLFYYGLDDDNDIQISYALSAFFFRYLVNRFGEDIIQKIYLCPYNDYRMVEYATGEDFGTLFYDFCLSLIVSGRGITDDPRYDVKEFYDGTLDFSLEEIFYEYYFPLSDYSSNMKPYSFVLFSLPPEVEEVTFQSENVLGLIL